VLGLSLEKIAVLLLLAVILVGPDRLPNLVRDAARLVRKLRTLADDATRDLREDLGPEFADLKPADLHPRALIQKHVIDPVLNDDVPDEPAPPRAAGRPPTASTGAGEPTPWDADAT
jgi:sec-independent protein translocase protein TatB